MEGTIGRNGGVEFGARGLCILGRPRTHKPPSRLVEHSVHTGLLSDPALRSYQVPSEAQRIYVHKMGET